MAAEAWWRSDPGYLGAKALYAKLELVLAEIDAGRPRKKKKRIQDWSPKPPAQTLQQLVSSFWDELADEEFSSLSFGDLFWDGGSDDRWMVIERLDRHLSDAGLTEPGAILERMSGQRRSG